MARKRDQSSTSLPNPPPLEEAQHAFAQKENIELRNAYAQEWDMGERITNPETNISYVLRDQLRPGYFVVEGQEGKKGLQAQHYDFSPNRLDQRNCLQQRYDEINKLFRTQYETFASGNDVIVVADHREGDYLPVATGSIDGTEAEAINFLIQMVNKYLLPMEQKHVTHGNITPESILARKADDGTWDYSLTFYDIDPEREHEAPAKVYPSKDSINVARAALYLVLDDQIDMRGTDIWKATERINEAEQLLQKARQGAIGRNPHSPAFERVIKKMVSADIVYDNMEHLLGELYLLKAGKDPGMKDPLDALFPKERSKAVTGILALPGAEQALDEIVKEETEKCLSQPAWKRGMYFAKAVGESLITPTIIGAAYGYLPSGTLEGLLEGVRTGVYIGTISCVLGAMSLAYYAGGNDDLTRRRLETKMKKNLKEDCLPAYDDSGVALKNTFLHASLVPVIYASLTGIVEIFTGIPVSQWAVAKIGATEGVATTIQQVFRGKKYHRKILERLRKKSS